MTDWLPRLRALLDKQFAVVIAALLVLALLGGWVTYTTHVTPDTTTVERPTVSWETTGQFTHSATVGEKNSVFPVGTTLTNRSVYFTSISPWLNGTSLFTYNASESGDLNQTVSLSLVIRGVEQQGQGQNETILWQTSRPLNDVSAESVSPGETVRVPFSLNVSAVGNRTDQIREQLGNPPGQTEVIVRASVNFQGTVNGNAVDRTNTYTLPVILEGNTYRPGSTDLTTEQHQATQTVTVQQTYGPLRSIGAPALLSVSFLALVGLIVARSLGRLGLSEAEQELLVYEDEREDFDEWISTIQLPDEVFDLPQAEAASLGALVDFAIDTDNSVIEDPDDDAYYVVHGDYLYTYHPPTGDAGGELGTHELDTSPEHEIDSESVSSAEPDVGTVSDADSAPGSQTADE